MGRISNLLASGSVFYDSVSVNATADGANTVIPAQTGKKIRVVNYMLAGTAVGTIILQTTGGTEKARIRVGGDGGGASFEGEFVFETPVSEGVVLVNHAGNDTFGHIGYIAL